MSSVVTKAVERILELKPYLDDLSTFTGSIALAQKALQTKNNSDYTRGLSGILEASKALLGHLDALQEPLDKLRAKSTTARSAALLGLFTMLRSTLVAYADKPSDALKPAAGGDPQKPLAVGFATAQRWVDLVSQIKQGEWAEAEDREKLNESMLAIFAFGPAGIVYVLAKEAGLAPDLGAALQSLDEELGISEALKKQAEGLARFWFGVKVAAGVTGGIAALFGVGYLVRSFRHVDE
ncbi:MAG: hypothetical protein R3B09_15980 [Nannocystaceae bacterium]